VVFWTFVIGPLGAVLAIPLTLLAKALLFDIDPNTRWIATLLETGPAPPEEADDKAADRQPEVSPGRPVLGTNGGEETPPSAALT
jgi:AI-2 transport protein TqsA